MRRILELVRRKGGPLSHAPSSSGDAEPAAGAGATRIAAGALLREAARGAAPGPHLVVVAGPGEGARLPLGTDQTIGRSARADLQLADPHASRVHARIRAGAAGAAVEDLGSKNGVLVNGRRIGRAPRALRPGDEIALGATRLAFTDPGAAGSGSADCARQGERARREGPGATVGGPAARIAAALLLAAAAALLVAG